MTNVTILQEAEVELWEAVAYYEDTNRDTSGFSQSRTANAAPSIGRAEKITEGEAGILACRYADRTPVSALKIEDRQEGLS